MDHASWQPSLLTAPPGPSVGSPGPGLGAATSTSTSFVAIGAGTGPSLAFDGIVRHDLAHEAWLDHVPGWLPGADELFDVVVDEFAWQQGTERIQGRDVPRPRLTASRPVEALDGALASLGAVGRTLSARYGVRFERVGVNLYRDGRDSVAWHGDRIARDLPTATIAIVSLGQARPFKARPGEGGSSLTFELGHGDLLVMGGTFQRTWKHAVPKVASAGPRVSVTYRHAYPVV